MYRACTPTERAARAPRPRGDDRGDPPRSPAPTRPTAFGRFCDWLERAVPGGDGALHRRQLRLGARPGEAVAGRPRAGAARRLRQARHARWRRSSTTSACSASSASSRCTPAWRRTRRWRCTRSSPTWTRSRACSSPRAACTRWPSGLAAAVEKAGRRRSATTPPVTAHPPRAAVDGCGSSGVDAGAAASGSPPTWWSATPTCPWPTARCSAASTRPRAARRGTYSPSCLLWVAGVRGLPPAGAAHHNIHFGHDWDGAFRALIHDGVRMPDPSILVTLHSLDDRHAGARRVLARSTCSSRRRTSTARSTGARERDRIVESLRARVAALGYPTDVVVERVYDPLDWERDGHGAGHAVRAGPHVPPDRPVPAEQRRPAGARAWCSSARPPCPASGVPMVLVSGKLAAAARAPVRARRAMSTEASHAAAGRRAGDARGELRAVPRAEQALRHHVLLDTMVLPKVEAAPRARAVRASAATPTTSSTTSARRRSMRRAGRGAGRLRRPVLRRPRRAAQSDDPVLKAVVHTVRAFDIDPDCFRRFLRSMTMDLTVATLRHVGRPARVHGRLGRGDRRDDAADPRTDSTRRRAAHARDLGDAFQLTNFLRDIGEDLDRGRQYLPQEDLRRFGVDLDRAPASTPAFVRADAVRDRPLPRAVPLGRHRHRDAARPLGALHRRGAGAVRPHPRQDRGAAATTCSPRGPACRRGEKAAMVGAADGAGRALTRRVRDSSRDRRRRSAGWRSRVLTVAGDDRHAAARRGAARGRVLSQRGGGRAVRPRTAAAALGGGGPRRAVAAAGTVAAGHRRRRARRHAHRPAVRPLRATRRAAAAGRPACRRSCRWRGSPWRCRPARPPTPRSATRSTPATPRRAWAPRR